MRDYSALINEWIESIDYPSKPHGLYEPVSYMLGGGGKRLRPTLLCATAEAFGLDCDNVKPQALGIEMLHNFTLLHDDVMDNADVRHGIPTVHRKWNVATAILSGDTMLTMAGRFMGDCDAAAREPVLELFNKTAIEIYEGQQYDMNFESLDNVTLTEYVEMIRLKTAVLLGCACRIGAILAGCNVEIQNLMYSFGEQIGLAFQLRDDYLDTYGDPSTFGKEIGGDILNDKKTWLRVKANEKHAERLAEIAATSQGEEKIRKVTDLYDSADVDKECIAEIKRYTARAIEYLDKIDGMPTEFKQFFTNLAVSAVKRNS